MDTTDTTPTTTDLVIIDAELVEETPDHGNSIVNTVATTAATSAVILGGMLAYKFLKPKVTSLFNRSKSEEPVVEAEVVEAPAETPETAEV